MARFMPMRPGTRLGPYQVSASLGSGGMGEVYRANDTRLGRDVAIKVLPQHLSSSPEQKARFEREARTISTLNHPHICHLYDIGSEDGTDFLVMELLEGETLADRLRRGTIPFRQALDYGIQIAAALDTAHRSGIVHRDLKPSNIMLTNAGAKLLDFGLAKPIASSAAAASESIETMSKPLTSEGHIVGTYQYMAPEQIRGGNADARTDIFAFGAVLYEVATGKRAFEGKSQISVMSAILEEEPEPISKTRLTPAGFEHAVETCLAKEPEERWQSAADLGHELRWIAGLTATPPHKSSNTKIVFSLFAATTFLISLVAAVGLWNLKHNTPANYEFYIAPPDKSILATAGLGGAPAISPDGSAVAFAATNAEGVRSLWIRNLNSAEPRVLAGTEEATYPFWAPDSRLIAFFSNGQLKKIPVGGGVPVEIRDVSEGRGGAWSESGIIIFGVRDGPLYEVKAAGGTPSAVTQLDSSKGEGSHRFPLMLPDGDHFLYVAQAIHTDVVAGSLKSKRRVAEFPDIDASVGFSNGHLFFLRGNTLFAQNFNPDRLQRTGEPVVVAEKVETDSQFDFSLFSVATTGALVFQPGTSASERQIFIIDRSGKQLGTVGGGGIYVNINVSPSGKELLVDQGEAAADKRAIWLIDLLSGTRRRVTFNDQSTEPLWSHDGQKIAFDASTAAAEGHIRDLISGADSKLFSLPGESLMESWSPDGRYLIYGWQGEERTSKWEIWAVETTDKHRRIPLLQDTRDVRYGRLSWDGHWIAYVGLDTGRPEVYVSSIDFTGEQPKIGTNKWQISTDGGNLPVWSRDGQELFFSNAPGTMLYSVPIVATGDVLQTGTIKKLLDFSMHSVSVFYDVSPDGKTFYVAESPRGVSASLTVLTDWRDRIKQK